MNREEGKTYIYIYIYICMYQCYSPILPHPLLPSLYPQTHSLCLHLYSCPANRLISTIFLIPCICISIQYLFLWITSLCITGSSFIHFTIMDFNSFLFMAELYSTVYMYHSFFIHSSVNGHLGCFHVLVLQIVLLWKLEYMCLWIMVFSGCMPSSGIARSYGNFIPSFLRNFHTALHNGCINLHFHKQCKRVPFSLQLLQHLSFIDFLMMPILTCMK